LVTKLIAKLGSAHNLTEDKSANSDEMMELDTPAMNVQNAVTSPTCQSNETFSIEEKSLANSTYILEADTVQKAW
jgi:hypothetical protein